MRETLAMDAKRNVTLLCSCVALPRARWTSTWRDNCEFILCGSGEEMMTEADRYRLRPPRVAVRI